MNQYDVSIRRLSDDYVMVYRVSANTPEQAVADAHITAIASYAHGNSDRVSVERVARV